jgi:hypothetical protein
LLNSFNRVAVALYKLTLRFAASKTTLPVADPIYLFAAGVAATPIAESTVLRSTTSVDSL